MTSFYFSEDIPWVPQEEITSLYPALCLSFQIAATTPRPVWRPVWRSGTWGEHPAQWSAQMRWVKCRAKKSYFQITQTGLNFSLLLYSTIRIFGFLFGGWGVRRGDRSVMKSQGDLQQPWVFLIPCNVFFKDKVFKYGFSLASSLLHPALFPRSDCMMSSQMEW